LSYTYDQAGNVASVSSNHVNGISVNRVAKTLAGVTTRYLVDDLNPTGYPQVVEELSGSVVDRQHSYGLQRINEIQVLNNAWTPSFYGYDGGGNLRQLTNSAGTVTDEYEYDAFGNSFTKVGTTPNNYLYRGEQYDSDLGLYYLRARYYNPATGRFLSRDPEDSDIADPQTLHKYLYASGDPVNAMDPTGRESAFEQGLIIGKIIGRVVVQVAFVACLVDTIYAGIAEVTAAASERFPRIKKLPLPPLPFHLPCIVLGVYWAILWASGLFFGTPG